MDIRTVAVTDVDAIAEIDRVVSGLDPADTHHRIAADLARIVGGDGPRQVWVAEVDGRVVAYGRASWLDWTGKALDHLPTGWYLNGVSVLPAFRRRGIARALVQTRLDWLDRRTALCRYLTGLTNEPSLRLHGSFGFIVEAEGIEVQAPSGTKPGWMLRRERPLARFAHGQVYGDYSGVLFKTGGDTLAVSDRFMEPLWSVLAERVPEVPMVAEWCACDGWTDVARPVAVQEAERVMVVLRAITAEDLRTRVHGCSVEEALIVAAVLADLFAMIADGTTVSLEAD